jgi:hypothetical protein
MKPLPPPDDAMESDDAVEVLRGWVVGEDLQVSLAFEAFGNNPKLWGQLLAEVAAHVADAMNIEGYGDRDAIFGKIRNSVIENMENPFAGLQGTIRGPVQ